ncbi:hypothetical protein CAPTEDRAFT_200099 [Capitella teleta]|uniref:Uncharacterized protein n=1 Tax=Capitella teleta TaxID=283909 RepID=R7USD7_CAPTE|nr:hypothetical protein CAPTEDRAFT_200099 [Capitella teleta]|eukprot:ELU09095.1 hypothetical protein CAPTEDRAFT_200099 [Capitella teleta]
MRRYEKELGKGGEKEGDKRNKDPLRSNRGEKHEAEIRVEKVGVSSAMAFNMRQEAQSLIPKKHLRCIAICGCLESMNSPEVLVTMDTCLTASRRNEIWWNVDLEFLGKLEKLQRVVIFMRQSVCFGVFTSIDFKPRHHKKEAPRRLQQMMLLVKQLTSQFIQSATTSYDASPQIDKTRTLLECN